ncbi:MAG: hypothetical protein WBZ42_00075 [Halobacteriota archaeon]
MLNIGKSKIGSLSARKGVRYPQLRLPQQCADVIGDMAEIFETERGGKRAFLIVTNQAMPKRDSVLKQSEEVLKHVEETGANARLSVLESEIRVLKSLLVLNENDSLCENEKQQWARPDSDQRPPPCEGDVIIDGKNPRRYQPAHRSAARLREHAGKHSA